MKNNIMARASIAIDTYPLKIWEALTTPKTIKRYFFGTDVISDWKAGRSIIFRGEWEGKKYEDKGTIINIVPNKLLKYNYWSSMSGMEDKPENYALITYELQANNSNETILTITQDNVPDEKMREHSEQNWMKVLTDLKALLEEEVVSSL